MLAIALIIIVLSAVFIVLWPTTYASQPGMFFAGFPCIPLSRLRHHSKLVGDPQARQFFETCKTIKARIINDLRIELSHIVTQHAL